MSHPALFFPSSLLRTLPRSVLECSALHTRRSRPSNASLGRVFSTKSAASLKPDTTFDLSDSSITTVQKATRASSRRITTLDPSKLTTGDYIDFSLKYKPTLRVLLQSDRSSIPKLPRLAPNPQLSWVSCASSHFPAGTHGFLYYHVPPFSSPLAGELRFRITSSSDPASFATGSDLLAKRSMPWRYPLYKMVCRPNWADTIALLLQDGLLTQHTLDLAAAAVAPLFHTSTNKQPQHTASSEARHPCLLPSVPVLSAFGQEFAFHFAVAFNFCAVFASPDTIVSHNMRTIGVFRVLIEGKYVRCIPFEGSAICCFERSTLPEHAGKRVVVIRIKRFIDSDPLRPAPLPRGGEGRAHLIEQLRPREGELLKVVRHRDRVGPWAADVDKLWGRKAVRSERSPWKALRVLFENEELYGSPHTSAS